MASIHSQAPEDIARISGAAPSEWISPKLELLTSVFGRARLLKLNRFAELRFVNNGKSLASMYRFDGRHGERYGVRAGKSPYRAVAEAADIRCRNTERIDVKKLVHGWVRKKLSEWQSASFDPASLPRNSPRRLKTKHVRQLLRAVPGFVAFIVDL